ncbi:MAG: BTAD domain-containing putative transcriptional regulator, partial [Actinomycetota bacterium]
AISRWADPLAEFAYDDWAGPFRERIERTYLLALQGRAAAAIGAGRPAEAIAFAERAAARARLHEPSHLLLVKAKAAAGDAAGALTAFDDFRRLLADELGIDPSVEAFEVQQWVLRGARPVDARASPGAVTQPHTLPFVGRRHELEGILALLARHPSSIVLITGAAGSGKSRLLAEVGQRLDGPVLSARAYLPEMDEAWALGRSLLRQVLEIDPQAAVRLPGRTAAALADVVPELGDTAPVATADAETLRALALEGAGRLLRGIPGATVVADDLQWADATSLRLLWRLIRDGGGPSLLLAFRPGPEMDAFTDSLRDHAPGSVVHRVEVSELPAEGIEELVGDDALAGLIADATDRMPFAVSELLWDLLDRRLIVLVRDGRWTPARAGSLETATTIARAGRRRTIVQRLEQQAVLGRKLVGLLHLLARETPSRVLARILDADEMGVIGELETLARSRLVEPGPRGWALAHELVGESFDFGVDPADRTSLH